MWTISQCCVTCIQIIFALEDLLKVHSEHKMMGDEETAYFKMTMQCSPTKAKEQKIAKKYVICLRLKSI